MQTQRLIGQQSLGGKCDKHHKINSTEFMGLHVDLERIFQDNMKKKVPNIVTNVNFSKGAKRKNNCIINDGDNPTKEERRKKIEENRIK
jgi:hypothetical protein